MSGGKGHLLSEMLHSQPFAKWLMTHDSVKECNMNSKPLDRFVIQRGSSMPSTDNDLLWSAINVGDMY